MLFLALFPHPVVNMEGRKTVAPCKFDILFTKSVPHILESIFFSLDYESFKTCLKVSTTWRELLTSETYITKEKSVFYGELVDEENEEKTLASG